MLQGGGITENLHIDEQKTQQEKQITRLTEIRRTPGNKTQDSDLTNRYISKQEAGITGNKKMTNSQRETEMCGLQYTGELNILCG